MRIALIAAILLSALHAVAETRDPTLDQARRAVEKLRASSYLPTNCERAFSAFWAAYISDGTQRMVRWPGGPHMNPYFGLGNASSEPLLAPALRICEKETGTHGDLVLRVLQEREAEKRERLREIQDRARAVTGY